MFNGSSEKGSGWKTDTFGCRRTLVALVLLVALLGAAAGAYFLFIRDNGATIDTHARRRLQRAEEHLTEYAGIGEQLKLANEALTEIVAGEDTPEAYEAAISSLTGIRALMESGQKKLDKASEEFTEILSMKTSETLNTYVELRLDAIKQQSLFIGTQIEAMGLRIDGARALQNGEAYSEEMLNRNRKIEELDSISAEYADTANRYNQNAKSYYDSHFR